MEFLYAVGFAKAKFAAVAEVPPWFKTLTVPGETAVISTVTMPPTDKAPVEVSALLVVPSIDKLVAPEPNVRDFTDPSPDIVAAVATVTSEFARLPVMLKRPALTAVAPL